MTEAAPAPPLPTYSPLRIAAYVATATLLAWAQGFGNNLVTANAVQIQGALGATANETAWLTAAYMAPNVSLSLLLIKIRTQFGLRRFAEWSIALFVGVGLLHFLANDLYTALIVRFASGIAAAPLSSLAFLYMLEVFPPQRKLTAGLALALTNVALGPVLTRLVSPTILDNGGWHGLHALEIGLAGMALAGVFRLPLTAPPRAKVLAPLDALSYGLIAVGFGCAAVAMALGRLYWWLEADWLGVLLALSLAALTASVLLELNRKAPFIDLRWLATPRMIYAALVLLVFRLLLSEQATGAAAFLQAMGLLNEQAFALNLAMAAAILAGGALCALLFRAGGALPFHIAGMACIAIGALLDAQATALTRPAQMLVSQSLIAFGAALFLPPAMAAGFAPAIQRGVNGILTFIAVFIATQSLGGLAGSALFGTFVTWREKFHSNQLTAHLTLADPLVADRVTRLGGAYGHALADPAAAHAQGLQALAQQATREATVLAYNDAFRAIGCIAAIALVLLLAEALLRAILKRRALHLPPVPTAT